LGFGVQVSAGCNRTAYFGRALSYYFRANSTLVGCKKLFALLYS
jgi:hypothetical protein